MHKSADFIEITKVLDNPITPFPSREWGYYFCESYTKNWEIWRNRRIYAHPRKR
jgi:hypothetical protein